MRKANSLVALLGMIAMTLAIAGCSVGGRIGVSGSTDTTSDGPAEVDASIPEVIAMSKTSAAPWGGTVSIFLTMSEALAEAPTVSSAILSTDGPGSVSLSKAASQTSNCTLLEDGSRVKCDITVTSCRSPVDFNVAVSGGASVAYEVAMKPYETNVNTADDEFGSELTSLLCWDQFVDSDGVRVSDLAIVDIADGALKFEITDCLLDEWGESEQDLANVSLQKEFMGHVDTMMTMKVSGVLVTYGPCAGRSAGMQFGPMASLDRPSELYHIIYGGIIAVSISDDALGTFYEPIDIDIINEPEYYYCIVKKGRDFSYFISTDGLNYTQLTAENTGYSLIVHEGVVPHLFTPIDLGIECPVPPSRICNPDAVWPWMDGEIVEMTWEECVAAAEASFDEETCSMLDFEEAEGLLYLFPIVRVLGTAAVGSSSPPIDFVRFKVADVQGDATDCAKIY